MASAQVCRNYLNGNCRYGNSCKFYHPPRTAQNNQPALKLPFQFTEDTIRNDLTIELPQWILSVYGAAKYEPNLIYEGELSPEELRWRSVLALKEGKVQEYIKEEETLVSNAKAKIASLVADLSATNKLAQKLHQTRFINGQQPGAPRPKDFSESGVVPSTQIFAPSEMASETRPGSTPFGARSNVSAFGGGNGSSFGSGGSVFGAVNRVNPFSTVPAGGGASSGSAFGQSAFGAGKPPAFGSSAFGAGSQTGSAFGSPAVSGGGAFGQAAFGQKSAGAPAFGTSTFGLTNPSTKSAFGSSAFGQSAKPSVTSSFGSSAPLSAFSQDNKPVKSAFGSSQAPSAFASTSQTTATPMPGTAFGQSAFGKPSGTTAVNPAATSVFGQSTFGQDAKQNPFGTQPQEAVAAGSGFGLNQPPAPAAGGFGAFTNTAPTPTNPFGQSSAPANPFVKSASATQPTSLSSFAAPATSAFGSTSAFGAAYPSKSTFGFANTSDSRPAANGFSALNSALKQPQLSVPVPPGWSYDDPWTWLLYGNAETDNSGTLEDEFLDAFKHATFDLGNIPSMPPPLDLRT
ncbi:hypothetical protein I314_01132 [Cryptococcus bacillisporus CA1873]|uniref:C3H1-type domain-containing protein n=1 Tax=Cryptococcus bacillisporus CA1873 TaxID=1296111 RepID=A0ABR5BHQ6_CRYGA|nr:hypothetical protein I314_01132 [Cryptococcus bacillisporus CA1873]|eukprot:KIR68709.1 hypothetical protein I314_01132 [Cryptococcus gattii CA1873]